MNHTARKRHWRDFTGRQKAALLLAAAAELTLKASAARDLARRPAADVRGSKALWAPLLLVNFVGPLAYFAFGRR